MREFRTQDGNIIHLPNDRQRPAREFQCDCHERLGNDFYFLPIGSCLREDKTCNRHE